MDSHLIILLIIFVFIPKEQLVRSQETTTKQPRPTEDPLHPQDPDDDTGTEYTKVFPPPGKQGRTSNMHPKECDPTIISSDAGPSTSMCSESSSSKVPAQQMTSEEKAIRQYPRPDCGLFAEKPDDARVYRGYSVWPGQFPWIVAIRAVFLGSRRERDNRPHTVPHCTGSLIEPTWVLTSAHCFTGKRNGELYYLLFNEPHVRTATRVQRFTRQTKAPGQTTFYRKEYLEAKKEKKKDKGVSSTRFDICLLNLYETAPGYPVDGRYDGHPSTVNTVCYYSSVKFDYQRCEPIVRQGYGRLGKEPKVRNPGFLHWAIGSILEHDTLKDDLFKVLPSQITTAVGETKYQHLCSGDSGSPDHWYQLSGRTKNQIRSGNMTHQISPYRAIQIGIHATSKYIRSKLNPDQASDYYMSESLKVSSWVRKKFFSSYIVQYKGTVLQPEGPEWGDLVHFPWDQSQFCLINDDEEDEDELDDDES